MITLYVCKRSELTEYMDRNQASGSLVFRTRTTCQCGFPFNRRNAVIIINGTTNTHLATAIRCINCARRMEVQNG